MMAKCSHQNCGGEIEFEATQLGQTIVCPHCGGETILSAVMTPPPPLPQPFLLTIGDIGITQTQIITPNGSGALAGSQWIFVDTSRTETKIPTVAIIFAIVFALLCLIGLLFLLMKEKTTTGYVEVTVRSGNVFHKTQIPVNSQTKIDEVRQLVNKAQALAMQAA
jgi:DNA-directed RNA polymerase subunit RPC12/RpoP